jgi:hypothetical protein
MYKLACVSLPFLGRWSKVEISDPIRDEIMLIQSLDPIWEKHAAKMLAKQYGTVMEEMKAVLLRPFHRIYNGVVMLVISKPGESRIPHFICPGCSRFFADKFNKRRCVFSHQVDKNGKIEKHQSQYDEVKVMKWWDTLPIEDRISIVGTHEIATIDLRVDVCAVNGKDMVMMLQASLEFTALLRQVRGNFQDFPYTLNAHSVANRLIKKYSDDCADVLRNLETQEELRLKQRSMKRLLKSASISDVAFKKLMSYIPLPYTDWSIENQQEDISSHFATTVRLVD